MMKLYVWVDPYRVSYGSSMVFAVAKNLREAKRMAKQGAAYSFGRRRTGTRQSSSWWRRAWSRSPRATLIQEEEQ